MKKQSVKTLIPAIILAVSLGFTACGNKPATAGEEVDVSQSRSDTSSQEHGFGNANADAVLSQDAGLSEESFPENNSSKKSSSKGEASEQSSSKESSSKGEASEQSSSEESSPKKNSLEKDAASDTMDSGETQGSTDGMDNFSVDGQAAKDFAEKIQKAVADRDLESLADMTAFPTYVGLPGEGIVVSAKEEFLALGADKIFTDKLLSSIEETDVSGLTPSMAGFFMQTASGEDMPSITFSMVNGSLAITGINY